MQGTSHDVVTMAVVWSMLVEKRERGLHRGASDLRSSPCQMQMFIPSQLAQLTSLQPPTPPHPTHTAYITFPEQIPFIFRRPSVPELRFALPPGQSFQTEPVSASVLAQV